AVPTLTADSRLLECIESLGRQTQRDFEVIIIDNSGEGRVRRKGCAAGARVIENSRNAGFGAAINQAWRASSAPFVATLNDDAAAHPGWLEALVRAAQKRPDAGMCASAVRLYGEERLDSAGMLMARDGSSKQRGHGRPPEDFPALEEVLFPSGSAALYRRAMLEELGGFDERFFLYCEDTDLGLRARWAGWKCLYVPDAVVEHHYSHSAGRASGLKAYYVERNRLFVAAKNLPAPMLLASPWFALARYFWHAAYLARGRGSAARFRAEGNAGPKMAWYVIRAHAALLAHAGRLWRERRRIRAGARVTPAVFRRLLRSHSISARRIAGL
ncbi:MAG: glycosyltransferase, partial [Acidobacteriia bacterium]|nr:glycosyltransferase [Terriglobia bacterium]